ncbi:5-formyltetrahydrofolate cyclo-ligase [Thiotrichales bacterium 19S9-12]|nr:5-formyltetrahydrofolate cyclo-ligase [Thiotrichales bacterium 19S9-11]MCF6812590.1 5-formyltetrahydrofolate cyclo-ligase [Thiotrichales bacterium 19S9-12]
MIMTKKEIRNTVRYQRKNLNPSQRFEMNQDLISHALNIIDKQKPKSIAIYFPNDGEADLSNLVEYANFKNIYLYLPIVHPLIKHGLWFSPYQQDETLYPNRFGIYEPFFNSQSIKAPWEMDLVFMPLVAFDSTGNRIGMGGGYYDFSFQFRANHTKPKLIGCAYEFQKVDQCPSDNWDIPIDGILTNGGFHPF